MLQRVSRRSSMLRGRQFAKSNTELDLAMRTNEPVLADEFVNTFETGTLLAGAGAVSEAADLSWSWPNGVDSDILGAASAAIDSSSAPQDPTSPEMYSALKVDGGGSVEISGLAPRALMFAGTARTL